MRKKSLRAGSTGPHIENVVFAPLGFGLLYQAWRKNVAGVANAPLPLFWGVSKTA